ncbi:hypothetical protein [Pantanalinema sp. GBBB05]|uniref:hypothetical protein n=1 Tax=Pantanalinema sp. GBBB05 TaxID=2604139 RepID=UPI001D8B320D|nr:hypothetical protein [Pantanalinema sp. GBBB05]
MGPTRRPNAANPSRGKQNPSSSLPRELARLCGRSSVIKLCPVRVMKDIHLDVGDWDFLEPGRLELYVGLDISEFVVD